MTSLSQSLFLPSASSCRSWSVDHLVIGTLRHVQRGKCDGTTHLPAIAWSRFSRAASWLVNSRHMLCSSHNLKLVTVLAAPALSPFALLWSWCLQHWVMPWCMEQNPVLFCAQGKQDHVLWWPDCLTMLWVFVSKAMKPAKSILCAGWYWEMIVQGAETGWVGLIEKTDTVLVTHLHLCFLSWIWSSVSQGKIFRLHLALRNLSGAVLLQILILWSCLAQTSVMMSEIGATSSTMAYCASDWGSNTGWGFQQPECVFSDI